MAMFNPIASTVYGSTGTQAIQNESLSADLDTYQELEGFNIVDGSTTVEYDNGTAWNTATEGTDYELALENGTVKPLSGGAIDQGDPLRVSYDYQVTSGTTTTIVQLVPLFVALMVLGLFAFKVQKGM